MTRPNWTEYFMSMVERISQRSTCDRGKPGCVFVRDNQILTTGYAGSPPGFEHCDEAGHDMEVRFRTSLYGDDIGNQISKMVSRQEYSQHCIRTVHAEQNAILQAAKRGIPLDGSTLYVSMTPCRTCTMMLISVGVKEVIAGKLYRKAQESIDMFAKVGIPITHLDKTVEEYPRARGYFWPNLELTTDEH